MGDWLQDRCNSIQKAQREHIQKSLGTDIEKARAGVYKPTKQNLKEGKAGQKYGSEKKEEKFTLNSVMDILSKMGGKLVDFRSWRKGNYDKVYKMPNGSLYGITNSKNGLVVTTDIDDQGEGYNYFNEDGELTELFKKINKIIS